MGNKKKEINNFKNQSLYPVSVLEIFEQANFLIPIYQRNYSWTENEITQLLEDIDSAIGSYFLGNLIVNSKENLLEGYGYIQINEVIDGQQRLTTLYLLGKYLQLHIKKDALRFEARVKSNQTLDLIPEFKYQNNQDAVLSQEIINGYKIIENYFKTKSINKDDFKDKLNNVYLILVNLPKGIDLNHYFEIMNTRGEQLELHEIAKARIINKLKVGEDKNVASSIWDACSNMNKYAQMNFHIGIRNKLFDKDWKILNEDILNFDDIKNLIVNDGKITEKRSLKDILKNRKNIKINDLKNINDKSKVDEIERFDSIISFPNFLLQLNATIKSGVEEETSLDDKYFLKNLEWIWKDNADGEDEKSEERAKNFIFQLLKLRVIFDRIIIKREYIGDYQNDVKWSLQRMQKYDNETFKSNYVATLEDKENKSLRALQSALRITYTSPKTMHWITLTLKGIANYGRSEKEILRDLENYCREKIEESNYQSKSGFEIEHIVFTYLDYLLYRDGYRYNNKEIISPLSDWKFQFRKSIEHYFPQSPIGEKPREFEELNSFGNLALITASGNSFVSNRIPEEKSNIENIVNQSLKLKIMAYITNNSELKWNKESSEKHKIEMYRIIEEDLKNKI